MYVRLRKDAGADVYNQDPEVQEPWTKDMWHKIKCQDPLQFRNPTLKKYL